MNAFYPLVFVLAITAGLLQAVSCTNLQADDEKASPIQYVSYQQIFPAQLRYSSQNVTEKVNKAIERKAAVWNEKDESWTFKYNHGTSILSEKEALPVVISSFGYVLADGHHDVLSSIKLNAEMIPIKVIADLSHLDSQQFWEKAEKKGWAYLYQIGGEKSTPPATFSDLVDDPNRYFAAITARKYPKEGSNESFGAEYPLWVKVGKDIPFIEFKISDALWAQGFLYDEEQMGNPPSEDYEEFARKVLLEAEIQGLRVVPGRTHYSEINLEELSSKAPQQLFSS
jgi:hypothetical protein